MLNCAALAPPASAAASLNETLWLRNNNKNNSKNNENVMARLLYRLNMWLCANRAYFTTLCSLCFPLVSLFSPYLSYFSFLPLYFASCFALAFVSLSNYFSFALLLVYFSFIAPLSLCFQRLADTFLPIGTVFIFFSAHLFFRLRPTPSSFETDAMLTNDNHIIAFHIYCRAMHSHNFRLIKTNAHLHMTHQAITNY